MYAGCGEPTSATDGAIIAPLSPVVATAPMRMAKVRIRNGTVDQLLSRPSAERRYEVTRDQLPLSCPTPAQYLWNAHPKVYLPIENEGEVKCPYCGTVYVLVDATA